MQSVEPTIETIMRPPVHTVSPETLLDDARQLFIAETMRSLIVVDQDRPVGIVSWAEIGSLNAPMTGKMVADAMTPNPPAVESSAPISAGREALQSTDHDVIPVVNESGVIVGEVFRRELLNPDQPVAPVAAAASEQFQVKKGMEVSSATGAHVGTVEKVHMDAQGRSTHLDVSSGRILKHHKRIPFDLVNYVEGQDVYLSIDKDELKRLPDV